MAMLDEKYRFLSASSLHRAARNVALSITDTRRCFGGDHRILGGFAFDLAEIGHRYHNEAHKLIRSTCCF